MVGYDKLEAYGVREASSARMLGPIASRLSWLPLASVGCVTVFPWACLGRLLSCDNDFHIRVRGRRDLRRGTRGERVQEGCDRTSLGLSTDEVLELERQGKTNAMAGTGGGVARIVAANVFTYFNAIFFALAVLLWMAGLYKSMGFVVPILANTIIGIVQQLRAKRVLDALALLDASRYQVIRDGREQTVASESLVLGDCVRLAAGQQVPADASVVAGEGTANESLLTGEPDEVEKSVGSELMSGSVVTSGNLTVRLTHVGADSYAARLQAEARQSQDRKPEMVLGVERIIFVAGIVVLPVGALMLWQKMGLAGLAFPDAVSQMVAAVIGMIPEGLYLLVTVALALSAMRLAKRKVLFHDMRSIETLARVKRSAVVAEGVTYLLGAPQFVLADTELKRLSSEIERRTRAGRRVLCLARKDDDGCARPLVLVSLANEVRSDARETFVHFREQGVEVRVISGDDPLTVSAVAREAGIADADRLVDATTLDTPERLRQAAAECVVFGRVTPDQKRELVSALRAQGHRVAMTGDGVNDILAMKEADCSIAMGAGSDAARQAAQVVLLDSDFSHMVEIVGEGRRDINNITRSATLFLYKNIFSLALALFTLFGSFPYPLSPNQISLISFFNIGLPAFLLAFEPNEERKDGRFLQEVVLRSLPAALTSFLAIAYLVRFAAIFEISYTDVATSSTFLLSVVGYLILIALITPTNLYRIAVLLVCVVGFHLCGALMHELFDISDLSIRARVLVVVFAVAEVGVLDTLGILFLRLRARISDAIAERATGVWES